MTRLQVETADAGSRAAAVTRRRLPAAFITIALVQAGESASTDKTPRTHTHTDRKTPEVCCSCVHTDCNGTLRVMEESAKS